MRERGVLGIDRHFDQEYLPRHLRIEVIQRHVERSRRDRDRGNRLGDGHEGK